MAVKRISGCESGLPYGFITPDLYSSESGQEMPLSKMQHPIDILFDFNLGDAATVPATGTWTVLRARAPGFITGFDAVLMDCGTTGDIDFEIKLNDSEKMASALTIGNADTNGVWEAGSIDGGATGFAFAADDLIKVTVTNDSSNDGKGPKVNVRGYYVGD